MDRNGVIERLVNEGLLNDRWAAAFVDAKGRCEYCARDLLMDRLGYAVAELDHIIPQSKLGPDSGHNIALACRLCNIVKSGWTPVEEGESATELLANDRALLVQRVRERIARKMESHDESWRKATEILHRMWWS